MTLAQSFARALAAAGTTIVYGMPGGGNNLDLIGACEDEGLRFVLGHGETAAAIMASVDAELRGTVGACVVTRGPGAASAVNGVAHALLDRTPVALITDAVGAEDVVRVSHQRLAQDALFAPVTKWSGTVGAAGADETIAAALRLAAAPPPGPVQLGFVPGAPRAEPPAVPGPVRTGSAEDARRLLAGSRRPVFALGVGALRAAAPLRELLAGMPWPVLTTYKAKGIVPESWDTAAGLLTGAVIEAPVLGAADVIVAVGLDPVELIPAAWLYAAPILSLGEWGVQDPYFEPAVELVGPLEELVDLVRESLAPEFAGAAPGRAARLAAEERLHVGGNGLGPDDVVVETRAAAAPGTVATVDAGAHMLVTMPLWEVDAPGEALISSGLATMGFALPAAIAAAIARPARQIVCFTGDGGLGMTLAELETISRLALAVVVVVFNDSALSLIEIKQRPEGHGGTNAVRYRDTDFAAVAGSFGIAARRADTPESLREALGEAFAERRPFLVDAVVDPRGYPQIMRTIRG